MAEDRNNNIDNIDESKVSNVNSADNKNNDDEYEKVCYSKDFNRCEGL